MSMQNEESYTPYDLGVAATGKNVFLYINLIGFRDNPFRLTTSTDGINFKASKKNPVIITENKEYENTLRSKDFRISTLQKQYYLMYKSEYHDGALLKSAVSKDLITWHRGKTHGSIQELGVIAPNYKHKGKYVMYYGEGDIKVAFSRDLEHWEDSTTVLKPHTKYFDHHPLEMASIIMLEEGILVLYYVKERFREGYSYSIGAALFDPEDPTKCTWRKTTPICTQHAQDHNGQLYPMGIVYFKEKLLMYFGVRGKYVFVVHYGDFNSIFDDLPTRTRPRLQKHSKNPIIQPVLHHSWEASATFNPAAVFDKGKVHLIYRAMGPENTSVLGYATSPDGLIIDERLPYPVYTPKEEFEIPGGNPQVMYMSGGGYGGCEDPRITKIDDKFYLTYIAYDGTNPPRVALTSISEADFHARHWNWKQSKLISPPGVVDKNCVVFPEKINGKFVIMHRIFPNILIDYLDDLEFSNRQYLKGEFKIEPRENAWDSRKVGAGAPPIKTKDGWLLIYHAVDDRNDSQYKIGAMLLDLNDPTKVLYRTHHPILEPTEWYENHGFKSGVAYPCGAVVINNTLFVYYGGADSVICTATKNLDELLDELKMHHPVVKKNPVHSRKVIHHYA